jgi:putative membrane protein
MTPFLTFPTVLAQVPPAALPPFSWSSWSGDGVLRGGLLLLAGSYLLGVGPLRRRFNLGPPVSPVRIGVYLSGVLFLLIALEGPIHELSDNYLFSAHMVQHMILVYAAPPLLLLGMPGWLLRPVLRVRGVLPFARIVTKPIPALVAFNVVFTLYHIPLYYNAVVENHTLHIAAHLLFIVLAVITWWPILSPLPEVPPLSYPLRLIYVFAQTFSGFIVGAFISNSPTVLYPFYAAAPRTWGLSAMDDQKIGGLIMWIVGGTYLLFVFSAVFFSWANAEGVHDDVATPIRRVRPRPLPERPGAAPLSAPPEPAPVPADPPVSAAVEDATSDQPAAGHAPRTVTGSPLDLGARHVVTSAPDRSRLN